MRLVFWQSSPSIHQSAHIKALAERAGCDVTLVVHSGVDAPRRRMGWTTPDFGKAKVIVAPDTSVLSQLVQTARDESTHIFSFIPPRPVPTISEAFLRALRTPARIGLLAEGQDPRGMNHYARRAAGKMGALLFGGRVEFILAIGAVGVRWFRRSGYSASSLFPYGYFVEAPPTEENGAIRGNSAGPIQLIYLGQCVPRKGVDLLLQALQPHLGLDWRLVVVGSGASGQQWSDLARKLALQQRIEFRPAMPNGMALKEVGLSDVLVLPSRWDGWGAVVNEALMRGVPVICSDACGAADLLADSWRGEVYQATSVPALSEALERWITRGKRTQDSAERIRAWSARINGGSAADYLLAVLEASAGRQPRPIAPWLIAPGAPEGTDSKPGAAQLTAPA